MGWAVQRERVPDYKASPHEDERAKESNWAYEANEVQPTNAADDTQEVHEAITHLSPHAPQPNINVRSDGTRSGVSSPGAYGRGGVPPKPSAPMGS
jgi:hypothetical protein